MPVLSATVEETSSKSARAPAAVVCAVSPFPPFPSLRAIVDRVTVARTSPDAEAEIRMPTLPLSTTWVASTDNLTGASVLDAKIAAKPIPIALPEITLSATWTSTLLIA